MVAHVRHVSLGIIAQRGDMVLISPYLVPGDGGSAQLVGTMQEGRSVRIRTNSLAANDIAAVHGGDAKCRSERVEGGVRLWELAPGQARHGADGISLFGSSGAACTPRWR